jgi:transcriptional regulator with XRE-family HTH domain
MEPIIGTPVLGVNRYSGTECCDNIEMSIGTRLKEARKAAGLTQVDLAERSGMKQSTISDLEIGKSRGTTNLALLASIVGVNALWLETGKGSRTTKSPTEGSSSVGESRLPASEPGLQWISSEEYRLLTNYRASTSGWKMAIQNMADEAEKEPSVRIADNKP